MEKWNFPNANGLGIQGVSNGSIETFKGNIMGSLTREICQNSLDAANGEGPVQVEFYQTMIDNSEFPGYTELKEYMNDALDYWEKRNNKKSMIFFQNACNTINKSRIPVLRISDFNTFGLKGAYDANDNSAWASMVYSEGVSNKSGSNSGSFGIGKSSIYAASALRTVFFSTYDEEKQMAVQGVSKLASFINNGELKYGLGYFGILKDNGVTQACHCIPQINDIYTRNLVGTDIYVMGFNNYSDWKDKIIISLLENFLLAIYNSELIVKVQDTIVNKDSLKSLLEKYKDERGGCASAYNYFQVLNADEEVYTNDSLIDNISGKVKLKVLIFKDSVANRTVLMSRSNGMKLFDKNRISSSIQFSAILSMEGEELNQYFARMEDPTHSSWQPDRYDREEDIKEAEKVIKNLNKWIRDTIIKKGTESYGEEIDVKGMEGLLPEFYELSTNKKKHESLENKSSKVSINKRIAEKPSVNFKTEKSGDSYYEYDGTGVLDVEGDKDTIDVPHNDHSEKKGGTGAPARGSEGEGNRQIKKFDSVNNYKKRIFISNAEKNEYTIKFAVNQNIEDCRLRVYISAESANVEAKILSAISDGKKIMIKDNTIQIGRVYKNFTRTVCFTIEADYQCNLEVKLYANKK